MKQHGVQHPTVSSTQSSELLADVLQLEGIHIEGAASSANSVSEQQSPHAHLPQPPATPHQQQPQPQQQQQHFMAFADSFTIDDSYPVSGDPMLSLNAADLDDAGNFPRSMIGPEEMIS